MSNIGGKLIGSRVPKRRLKYMGPIPLGIFLWMHEMDHTTTREGPSSSGVHQYFPYLAHQGGYQRLRTTFGSEIPWGSTQIDPH
jgi:hypothetical protein